MNKKPTDGKITYNDLTDYRPFVYDAQTVYEQVKNKTPLEIWTRTVVYWKKRRDTWRSHYFNITQSLGLEFIEQSKKLYTLPEDTRRIVLLADALLSRKPVLILPDPFSDLGSTKMANAVRFGIFVLACDPASTHVLFLMISCQNGEYEKIDHDNQYA